MRSHETILLIFYSFLLVLGKSIKLDWTVRFEIIILNWYPNTSRSAEANLRASTTTQKTLRFPHFCAFTAASHSFNTLVHGRANRGISKCRCSHSSQHFLKLANISNHLKLNEEKNHKKIAAVFKKSSIYFLFI